MRHGNRHTQVLPQMKKYQEQFQTVHRPQLIPVLLAAGKNERIPAFKRTTVFLPAPFVPTIDSALLRNCMICGTFAGINNFRRFLREF